MNGRMLVSAVAVTVWYMIWDLFLFGPLFGSFLAGVDGAVEDPALQWVFIGNLAGALVLTWFYGKVGSSFGKGLKGGLSFGVSVGIVMGFPMWLFMSVYDTGWTYSASWAMVVANILWVGVAGLILGLLAEKMAGRGETSG